MDIPVWIASAWDGQARAAGSAHWPGATPRCQIRCGALPLRSALQHALHHGAGGLARQREFLLPRDGLIDRGGLAGCPLRSRTGTVSNFPERLGPSTPPYKQFGCQRARRPDANEASGKSTWDRRDSYAYNHQMG